MRDPRFFVSRAVLLGVAALTASLAGCGGGRPIKYYHLTYPSNAPASRGTIDATLMVRPFEASHLYLDDKIVYGFSSPEMGTYEYQRWEESPAAMLENALVRGLRASGLFGGVYLLRAEANGQFLLSGHLYDFKEVEGDPMVARLSYEVRMRDRKSGTIVWNHFYAHDEPASEKTIGAFVQAMDKNVSRSVQEVQEGLVEYFRAYPPK